MRGLNRMVGLLMTVVLLAAPISLSAQSAPSDQYLAAGNKLYAAKDYEKAIQYFNAAIKLNPNNAGAYQVAGNCYYALGNKKNALAYYQRASSLQPANAALAQFVRNLSAQVNSGAAAAPSASPAARDYLGSGAALFKQKQYAASIPYFRAAIQQNPNDYKGYYYSGYAYYMTGNAKYAAFYFGVANAKQPNASIKAYADRVKSSLPSDGQQWVDDMVSKYSIGGMTVAGGGTASHKKSDIDFGFHVRMGGEYLLADPAQITDFVSAAGSVSLSGLTPNIIPFPEIEPFIQIGKAFEINLAFGYFPVGNLSYTTYDFDSFNHPSPYGGSPDTWSYNFNTNIITADLGAKILFGDKDVTGYFGVSGGISPISLEFGKYSISPANGDKQKDDSTGSYNTMAINGQALLGVDISLGKGLALGPYVGFRYLNATDFKKGGNTLVVDTLSAATGKPTGAVGVQGEGVPALGNATNIPLGDTVVPLTLDFSGIIGGVDLTFSF